MMSSSGLLASPNISGKPTISCCNSSNFDIARGFLGSICIGGACMSTGGGAIGEGELSAERLVIDGDKLMLRVGLVQISGLGVVVAAIDGAAVRLDEAADVLCVVKIFSGAVCGDSGVGAAMCVCD